jgi:hypothetical protein
MRGYKRLYVLLEGLLFKRWGQLFPESAWLGPGKLIRTMRGSCMNRG